MKGSREIDRKEQHNGPLNSLPFSVFGTIEGEKQNEEKEGTIMNVKAFRLINYPF